VKKTQFYFIPLLAGTLSLISCQPAQTPTGSKVASPAAQLTNKNLKPGERGFKIQDWVINSGAHRGPDGMTSLNVQLDFLHTTARSPNTATIDMGTPVVYGAPEYEPIYNIFFSDYMLDANGHQLPRRGFLIFDANVLPSVSGQDETYSVRMHFDAFIESTDGIHFHFVGDTKGNVSYGYGAPDAVEHGNIGVCHFGETGDIGFQLDLNRSTLTKHYSDLNHGFPRLATDPEIV